MLRNEQATQKIFIAQTNLFGLWQTEVKLDLAELKRFDIPIDNNLKAKIKPYLVKEISALQTRLDNFYDDYQCQVNKKAAASIVIAMAIGLILGGGIAAMAACINKNKDDCSTSAALGVPVGALVGTLLFGALAFRIATGGAGGMPGYDKNARDVQMQVIQDQLDEWKAVASKLDINIENELKLVT